MGSSSSLPAYDPKIIEQFADKLYGKAYSFVAGAVVIGASLGAQTEAQPAAAAEQPAVSLPPLSPPVSAAHVA